MSVRNNRFTLNRENKRFLGVCAGLADYLEVPTVVIRIITLLACLTWPTLILVYFVAYWWLKHDNQEGKMHNIITDSKTAEHFRNVDYRKEIYRNPNNSRIAGVCSGLADYLEISAFSVRLITLLSFFVFGPFTFFAYCVCWIVLERNPDAPRYGSRKQRRAARRHRHTQSDEQADGTDAAEHSQASSSIDPEASIAMSIQECSAVFNKVETRLRDVEAFITSKKFRLHCEINRI